MLRRLYEPIHPQGPKKNLHEEQSCKWGSQAATRTAQIGRTFARPRPTKQANKPPMEPMRMGVEEQRAQRSTLSQTKASILEDSAVMDA